MRAIREWMLRIVGTFRRRRSDEDLEEELRLHLDLASEAEGVSRVRAGGMSQALDAMRDQRGAPRLEAIAADVVFGWRQLTRHRVASLAAIVSLGVTLGAAMAAFRLVDAVFLRPLPIADPASLFAMTTTFTGSDGVPDDQDEFDYPSFQRYASAIGDRADLLIVGSSAPMELNADSGDPERVRSQFVSGNVFGLFGLRPAIGRLLEPADDVEGHANQVAVLSYDFWTRRFGRDPTILHKKLDLDGERYEVIGVCPEGFTGTEPGTLTDLFAPAMTNSAALNSSQSAGWSWFRLWFRPKSGVAIESLRQRLQIVFSDQQRERLRDFPPETPRARIDQFLKEQVRFVPAASGISGAQTALRTPMLILGALVTLVLLIACANIANLQAAQALARSREMALRVSIGAGRGRLVQLVLVESLLLAITAAVVGWAFAAWSAPFVASMFAPAEEPVRLMLDVDWRVIGFGVAATMMAACLSGLAPALRASAVDPVASLKETASAPARARLASVLVAAQAAFCVLVLSAGALFVTSFERLSNRSLGFSSDGVLLVEANVQGPAVTPEKWGPALDSLRALPGVLNAAVAGWAPLSGNRQTAMVGLVGGPMDPRAPYIVNVSPSYFDTLRIGFVEGRDFRSADVPAVFGAARPASEPVAIVNEAFARQFFDGRSPVGRSVNIRSKGNLDVPVAIVGLVRDTSYSSVREAMHSIVYFPMGGRRQAAVFVRTSGNDPLVLASSVRQPLKDASPQLQLP